MRATGYTQSPSRRRREARKFPFSADAKAAEKSIYMLFSALSVSLRLMGPKTLASDQNRRFHSASNSKCVDAVGSTLRTYGEPSTYSAPA